MKTKRAQFIKAVLVGSLAFSGLAAGTQSAAAPYVRTTRESVSSAGLPAAGMVQSGSLSANGRYVVFTSLATNLVAGVTGMHVYRHDRTTGATVLVTVAKSGTPSAVGGFAASISADGRFVSFASTGNDFVDGDTNGMQDIFLRDMNSGATRMVSADQTGAPADQGAVANNVAGKREISDDGRYVAFASSATNLVATPNSNKQQVYVKDMATGVVTRASVDATGAAGNENSSAPALSGNGHVVAFVSQARNLSPLSTSGSGQIFVRDLALGTTTLESLSTTGKVIPDKASLAPALSWDGLRVAFETTAQLDSRDKDGLSGGTTGWDVYLRDRAAGATVFASYTDTAVSGSDSRAPAISADGRWIGFHSKDDKFVDGDTNNGFDVFLHDTVTSKVSLVSQNDSGQQADQPSTGASVSADGGLVLFASHASNLVTTPSSTGTQLYAHHMGTSETGTNEAPVVTLGADANLAEGAALSRVASFTDEDASTRWTATVNYGDGSATAPLALASNKTFTLDHFFAPGRYVVTVAVTDDAGATGSGSFRVTVSNVAPTVNLGGTVDLTFDSTLRQSGTFNDPGTAGFWATVDYGDGSGGRALALSGKSFLLGHTYNTAGTYTVTVSVTDGYGASGTGTLTVNVRRFRFQWHEPVESSFTVGRLLPVKFSVLRADGTPVFDSTVRVDVLDASGAVVVGYIYSANPTGSVSWGNNGYHVNVDTRGFAPGDYTLRVSFSSPALAGSFTKQTTVTVDAPSSSDGKGKDKSDKGVKAADKK